MRIVVLVILGSIAVSAFAGPPLCGTYPVLTTTKDDGTSIGIVISDEQRKTNPKWNVESGEPPLPISKAVAAAKAWGKKTYTRYDDVHIESVSLSSLGCSTSKDQWYYVIHFAPVIDGNELFGGNHFAAVLMDGTVIGPVPVKRDF